MIKKGGMYSQVHKVKIGLKKKRNKRIFVRSGSIVTNEGKPSCAFVSKLDRVVVDLWCTTPGINYGIGKKS